MRWARRSAGISWCQAKPPMRHAWGLVMRDQRGLNCRNLLISEEILSAPMPLDPAVCRFRRKSQSPADAATKKARSTRLPKPQTSQASTGSAPVNQPAEPCRKLTAHCIKGANASTQAFHAPPNHGSTNGRTISGKGKLFSEAMTSFQGKVSVNDMAACDSHTVALHRVNIKIPTIHIKNCIVCSRA